MDIKRVQNRLLEMAVAIKDILENENIPYMITFGTLLGAVRHGGFIPWDDDFDFFLFQEDYDRAIHLLRQNLPWDMFVEDASSEPLYFHSWAHVKDLNTIAFCDQFPQDNIYSHKGLSIDLYVTVKMDERDIDAYRLKEDLLYRKRLYNTGVINEEKYLELKRILEEKIAAENTKRLQSPLLGEQLAMVMNERIMYCNEVFPLKEYAFERTSFLGPQNADAVLTRFYGDYMKVPPVSQQLAHYTSVLFL